jgi:hypothetical protein
VVLAKKRHLWTNTTPYLDSSVKERHVSVSSFDEGSRSRFHKSCNETVTDESDCIRIFGLVERYARAMMRIRAWGANRLSST